MADEEIARAVTEDGFYIFCAYDELVEIQDLKPNPRNPNKHPDAQIDMLANIIGQNGWRAPITVSKRSGYIVRGHARRLAAIKAGSKYAPVDYQDYDSDEDELADLVADNRIGELAVLDEDQVTEILQQLADQDYEIDLSGYSDEQFEDMLSKMAEDNDDREEARRTLADKFLVPPFSIFDARSSVWNLRKNAWKRFGIKSEIGRGNDDDITHGGLVFSNSSQPVSTYKKKEEYETKLGRTISWEEFADLFPNEMKQGGTSIFDPVLCEIMYRWFCPEGGKIIDPFAGGSVRGIVASLLGRKYTGVDLSQRQIDANIQNWGEIEKPNGAVPPIWICGDSSKVDELVDDEFDFFFTCPPYADLEVYSDDPADLSNKDYPDFLELYRGIIKKVAAMLKNNRFAAVVVGEVRDKNGVFYNFVGDTIKAFLDAGLDYYNEAILITPYGSLATRAGRTFKKSRKLGKTHQNVLVFVKGDPKIANEELGDAEVSEESGSELDGIIDDLVREMPVDGQ